MIRNVSRLLAVLALSALAVVAGLVYRHFSQQQRDIQQLTQENQRLVSLIDRLSLERRVAVLVVTDQQTLDDTLVTDVSFVEFGQTGQPLPPRKFTIRGSFLHVDAQVIRFERSYIEAGDELRGRSIALFTRLYGSDQTPADGQPIDPPGQMPAAYLGADPAVTAFETDLWANFWDLFKNEPLRKQRGVKMAYGEGVHFPAEKGQMYTITLKTDAGLSVMPSEIPAEYLPLLNRAGSS